MNSPERIRRCGWVNLLPLCACSVGVLTLACERGAPADDARVDEPPAAEEAPIIVEGGFATPESSIHDPVADVYLVANINGDPLGKADNGFIARVSPAGEIVELRWIDAEGREDVTLHAPKGLAIRGDSLFVMDIDAVRIFHRETGLPLATWEVPGATFMNAPAVGPDGTIYGTDTGFQAGPDGFAPSGTDAVYRFLEDGTPEAIATGDELGRPNGIIADEDGPIVVTFGSNHVYRLDTDGERRLLAELPGGTLDGIVRLADGSLAVSSWETESIYRVRPDGSVDVLIEGVPSPADVGYDAGRGRLLIPVFLEDRLEIHPVR